MASSAEPTPLPVAPAVPDPRATPPFFAVSLLKLAVLHVCTLGVYGLYWFFKQWQVVERREGTDISPFGRAFFAFFFCYALFKKVRDYPASVDASALPAGALTAGFIVTALMWRLPEPYSILGMLSFLFLLPVQAAINRLNAAVAPDHDRNASFSGWNWVVVAVGGCVAVLAVIGSFLPPP